MHEPAPRPHVRRKQTVRVQRPFTTFEPRHFFVGEGGGGGGHISTAVVESAQNNTETFHSRVRDMAHAGLDTYPMLGSRHNTCRDAFCATQGLLTRYLV